MKKLAALLLISSVIFTANGQTVHHKQKSKRKTVRTEAKVYICNSSSAYAYHSGYCRGLNRCTHSVSRVSISEARNMGYVPCKICY